MKEMSKLSKFGRIIMVLTMVLSVGLSLFNNPLSADAAEDGKITVHKKQFNTATPTDPFPLQNTGGIMTEFDALANVEGAKFGVAVVTKAQWDAWKAAGSTYAGALTLYNNATEKETEITTGADGIAAFTGLSTDKMYLVIELAPLAEGITDFSAPIFINVPYSDGNKDIHLYPKNQYTKGTVELIKKDQNGLDVVEGAGFRLYKANTDGSKGAEIPNTADADGIYYTDANGKIQFAEMLVGDYILEEVSKGWVPGSDPKEYYGISNEAKNFEFTVSAGDFADGAKTITLSNPKETIKTPEYPSYDAGSIVKWTAEQPVPATIGEYEIFRFHDTLDPRLGYVATPATVLTVESSTGTALGTLVAGQDYNVTTAGTPVTVTFDITPAGRLKLQGLVDALPAGQTAILKMVFHTELLVDVPSIIPNAMDYEFNDKTSETTKVPGPPTEVETGGRKFIKVDTSKEDPNDPDKPLALKGAEFKVYKVVGGNTLWYKIDKTNPAKHVVTWVVNEADATPLISDDNGNFQVEGVAYGTYWLKETKAPEGYGMLANPVEFTVDKNSFVGKTAIEIENSEAPTLPITGGMGTVLFALVGIMLMGGAYMFYRKSKTA